LCQRTDNLLNASASNNEIDELRLTFSASSTSASVGNVIGELIISQSSATPVRSKLAKINPLHSDDANNRQMEMCETQTKAGTNDNLCPLSVLWLNTRFVLFIII